VNPERQETQTADDGRLGRPWGIVGTWLGTTGTGAKLLTTFHADGTVINSVQGEASTNPARPPHTSRHGVWRYLGEGQFGVTMWDIFYDIGTSQLIQYTKIRLEVTLGDERDEASARSRVEFLDPQGVLLHSRSGTSTYSASRSSRWSKPQGLRGHESRAVGAALRRLPRAIARDCSTKMPLVPATAASCDGICARSSWRR
jgi:hypothetical protein